MAKREKTLCPLTFEEFAAKATAMKVTFGDQALTAAARRFATGSFGWYLSGKIQVVIDGKPVAVQVGANMIVVGSKEAK